jgi:hypothetical protein
MTTPSSTKIAPRIRPATLADKEGWVNAVLTGFELDPQFTWRYPYRKEYPEDAKKGTRDLFVKKMTEGHSVRMVAELPRNGGDGEWIVVGQTSWAFKELSEVEREEGEFILQF